MEDELELRPRRTRSTLWAVAAAATGGFAVFCLVLLLWLAFDPATAPVIPLPGLSGGQTVSGKIVQCAADCAALGCMTVFLLLLRRLARTDFLHTGRQINPEQALLLRWMAYTLLAQELLTAALKAALALLLHTPAVLHVSVPALVGGVTLAVVAHLSGRGSEAVPEKSDPVPSRLHPTLSAVPEDAEQHRSVPVARAPSRSTAPVQSSTPPSPLISGNPSSAQSVARKPETPADEDDWGDLDRPQPRT